MSQEQLHVTGLNWTKPEIDAVIERSQYAIQQYLDTNDDTHLREAIVTLHEASAVLDVLQFATPSLVLKEISQVIRAVLDTQKLNVDESLKSYQLELVIQGILQLPNYLEYLNLGYKDVPVVLLPLLNQLREARGEKKWIPAQVFFPLMPSELIPSTLQTSRLYHDNESIKIRAEYMRTLFQGYLLRWLKNDEPQEALSGLADVCDQLSSITIHPEIRQLFWVAAACFDGIAHGYLEYHIHIKHAMAKIEREIKKIAANGHEQNPESPKELTNQLLFFIAYDGTRRGRIKTIVDYYDLDQYVYSDEDVSAAQAFLSGRNQNVMNASLSAIREDLLQMRDAIDLSARGQLQQLTSNIPAWIESIHRIGETLGMIGALTVKDKMVLQKKRLSDLLLVLEAKSGAELTSDLAPEYKENLLAFASDVLSVEQQVEQMMTQAGKVQAYDQNLDAKTSLAKEAAINITTAKAAITSFIETRWDSSQLTEVPGLLKEVSSVLKILDFQDVQPYFTMLSKYIVQGFLQSKKVPSHVEMDRIADIIVCLEYYVESIRDHQTHHERILEVAREAFKALGPQWDPISSEMPFDVVQLSEKSNHEKLILSDTQDSKETSDFSKNESSEPVRDVPENLEDLLRLVQRSLQSHSIDLGEPKNNSEQLSVKDLNTDKPISPQQDIPAPYDAAPIHVSANQYELNEFSLSKRQEELYHEWTQPQLIVPFDGTVEVEIDDDIYDIFGEEMQEELAVIVDQFAKAKQTIEITEELKSVRKSFHTIKGSSRLIGAETLGEVSWRVEGVLNKILEGRRHYSHHVIEMIEKAIEYVYLFERALKKETVSFYTQEFLFWSDRLYTGEDISYQDGLRVYQDMMKTKAEALALSEAQDLSEGQVVSVSENTQYSDSPITTKKSMDDVVHNISVLASMVSDVHHLDDQKEASENILWAENTDEGNASQLSIASVEHVQAFDLSGDFSDLEEQEIVLSDEIQHLELELTQSLLRPQEARQPQDVHQQDWLSSEIDVIEIGAEGKDRVRHDVLQEDVLNQKEEKIPSWEFKLEDLSLVPLGGEVEEVPMLNEETERLSRIKPIKIPDYAIVSHVTGCEQNNGDENKTDKNSQKENIEVKEPVKEDPSLSVDISAGDDTPAHQPAEIMEWADHSRKVESDKNELKKEEFVWPLFDLTENPLASDISGLSDHMAEHGLYLESLMVAWDQYGELPLEQQTKMMAIIRDISELIFNHSSQIKVEAKRQNRLLEESTLAKSDLEKSLLQIQNQFEGESIDVLALIKERDVMKEKLRLQHEIMETYKKQIAQLKQSQSSAPQNEKSNVKKDNSSSASTSANKEKTLLATKNTKKWWELWK